MQENDSNQDINTTVPVDEKSSPVRILNKKQVIWLVAGIVFVALVIVGLVFGRLAIAVLPGTRAKVVSQVCTADDVAIFNKNSAGEGYKPTIEAIAKRAGSGSDVTCVFMEYKYSYDRGQYSKARENAATIEKLVAAGNAIDNRINDIQSLQVIRLNIEAVKGLEDGKMANDDGDVR